jgi:FAD/FMN-containing dehydrogenase
MRRCQNSKSATFEYLLTFRYLLDLVNLNNITLSADQTQTSIGPGNRWVDVYSYLQSKGLAVIGGRVSDIGVGGLTLGGGISFFSGRFGWACDNVNNYQVSIPSKCPTQGD